MMYMKYTDVVFWGIILTVFGHDLDCFNKQENRECNKEGKKIYLFSLM